jgi:hypothetical protein
MAAAAALPVCCCIPVISSCVGDLAATCTRSVSRCAVAVYKTRRYVYRAGLRLHLPAVLRLGCCAWAAVFCAAAPLCYRGIVPGIGR